MSAFLDALKQRVLLCDGGMGARVQSMAHLDLDDDFQGQENCTEILNLSRPDVIVDIHRGHLAAGADVIQTNTFGASPITLAEFDLGHKAREISRIAAELAHDAVAGFAKDGRQRFVVGSVGPGTKLPTLGQIDYDSLETALAVQATGLVEGGVDAILVETVQDLLQMRAAVNGARLAMTEVGREIPVLVQVTVETTGTLLVGADIAAAATAAHALKVDGFGLNCATGPQEMAEHVRWVAEHWPGPISVQPNAGLPELVDGETRYPLSAEEMAGWLRRFVAEDGVGMVGGCCGTGDSHIAALDGMLRELGDPRPAPKPRQADWVPSIASLYSAVPYRQENAYLSIGERCNANGSKKFREAQAEQNWDACVAIGREQTKEGSHALDLCTAFVGRDEIADMTAMVPRLASAADAPLVIDSTELPVLEEALKRYPGKGVLNSINLEDGEPPADARLALARKHGAAVVALTIDEDGMAKTVEQKVAIAKRLYDIAVNRHGLTPEDLLIDPLTFTIATGNEDDRKLGIWTLDGIEAIAKALPRCQIILGLSNISFGLNPAARHVLNSVYLDHALKRGMTGAIVHVSKILPLHQIPEEEVKVAEDLIFDRRAEGYDPLQAFMALFADRKSAKVERERPANVEDRLKQRIVDGDRQGLPEDLDEALGKYPALDIINTFLLDGMKVVGELFGAGKMQLPFVLQSAETMKAAVAHLEPHMERTEGQQKGTVVLATVKGDVHDIGKNLVDIILTNNGYKVVNLGIKQPIGEIITAARHHKADAIGMSGLLVKSTAIMRENLEEMSREKLDVPVLLGGAALTRRYVEEDCRSAYAAGRVAYARDAFDGLAMMDHVVGGTFDDYIERRVAANQNRPVNKTRKLGEPTLLPRPMEVEEIRVRREELARGVEVPEPPFWGSRLIEKVPLQALVPYLNERMLFQFHWGYRKQGRSLDDYMAWTRKELRPVLTDLLHRCHREEILRPQAVYGYYPAAADGDALVIFNPGSQSELARFDLPRQARSGGLCVADFFRDVSSNERDVIALQAVTVGQRASDVARQWFEEDHYQDYLYLHGLGVEMAEAMAEYVHKRIRAELGFGHEDAREREKLLSQGYRGSRYSFGYPACPNLADQAPLLSMLGAERIGLQLAEEFQLHPEASTSAIVVHHPQAKYFSV